VEHYVDDWGWELHKYARLNNAVRVRKALRYEIHLEAFDGSGKAKEVLNWQDEDFGQCALWWLAMHGNLSLINLLINLGCDVNLSDKDGWTPLSVAAFYGHAEVIKALLAAGADPSKEVEDGDTAYDKAVAWDHPEAAALLKGACADVPHDPPCADAPARAPLAQPAVIHAALLTVARLRLSLCVRCVGRVSCVRACGCAMSMCVWRVARRARARRTVSVLCRGTPCVEFRRVYACATYLSSMSCTVSSSASF
jgi:hypothetical protein